MSDYNSSLPIRSEADGSDERLHVKIVDGTNPSINQVTVDNDKNLHVEIHGNDPAAVDRVIRTSELGALTPDGVYSAAVNTKPGNVGLVASERSASPGDATQSQRLTSVTNGNKRLLDISMHDELGNAYSSSNPIPVSIEDSEGDEIHDYDTSSAIAAAATDNHDLVVTASKTLKLAKVHASASGKMKIEIQVSANGTLFVTKFVCFNSTSSPNIDINLDKLISVVGVGSMVRVIRTNLDKQSMDVYSTIVGVEV